TTTKAKNINKEAQLHAKLDGKKVVISEASIKRDLRFGDKGVISEASIRRELRFGDEGEALGEDIEILTEPHPTHTITQPLTSKPQKKQKPRKPRRHDTKEIQPSDPVINVADEYLPEDIVPTHSNDPPLLRVNTLGSRDDRIQLKELMELCTKLSDRVLNLETTKTSQAKEIANLKKRVNRLERQRKDEDIYGVNDQDDTSMFDADKDLQGEEVVVEEVNAASIATSVTAAATTVVSFDELTLAQALVEIKTSIPKAK
nr:hypothetical protein [Tanacetum cinerariifolium]